MTTAEQVQQAIRDSVRENRIVIIEERHRSAEWEALETELLCAAEDHADIVDAAEGIALRRDYWGTTEDGEEWRIYLDGFHFEATNLSPLATETLDDLGISVHEIRDGMAYLGNDASGPYDPVTVASVEYAARVVRDRDFSDDEDRTASHYRFEAFHDAIWEAV